MQDNESQVLNDYPRTDRQWNGLNVASIVVFDADPALPQPQIVSESAPNVTLSQNGDGLLEVVATGTAPLRYQWYTGTTLPPDPFTAVPGDWTPVGFNRPSHVPDTSTIGTQRYWVVVSNAISDGDAAIYPAVSQQFTVRTLACAALEQGDCGQYRINFTDISASGQGSDIAPNDDSLLAWASVEEGQIQFTPLIPNGGASVNQVNDNSIGMPGSHDSYLVSKAINLPIDSSRREDIFEYFVRTGTASSDTLTWELPVDNGSYVVRLYGADQNGNSNINERDSGRFEMLIEGGLATVAGDPSSSYAGEVLNGDVGDSYMELIDASAEAANPGSTSPLHRVPVVLDMEPVSVSDGSLSIEIIPRDGIRVNVMGLEVLPVTSTDLAIQTQPRDVSAVTGDDVDLTVVASGDIDTVTWYAGTPGDTSGGALQTTSYPADTTLVTDTYTVSSVAANGTYWARIENTTPDSIDTEAATINVCSFDPNTLGSCNRWFLNVGEDTDLFAAADGTVWHPVPASLMTSVDVADYKTDGVNTWIADNFNKARTHTSGDTDSVFATRLDSADFNLNITEIGGTTGPLANGTYTVKVYFGDPEQNSDRQFDVDFEGLRLLPNYQIDDAAGGVQQYRVETLTVTVGDGTLNIAFSDDNGTRSTVSAIEIVPQSAN